MKVALTVTYHDPDGYLFDQIERMLPTLQGIFDRIAVRASDRANEQALYLFANGGALIKQGTLTQLGIEPKIGAIRREAIALALQLNMPFILCCDGDRALHWAEQFPNELARIVNSLPAHDFTVLGRTKRAFNSHPHVQRDTEAIVNRAFLMVSGYDWDVMVGARGLSRRAAEAILEGCPDEEISTDVSWPLYLKSIEGFSLGYTETDGLEFETPAKYSGEIKAVGYNEWLKQHDSSVSRWLRRLEIAQTHLRALNSYQKGTG